MDTRMGCQDRASEERCRAGSAAPRTGHSRKKVNPILTLNAMHLRQVIDCVEFLISRKMAVLSKRPLRHEARHGQQHVQALTGFFRGRHSIFFSERFFSQV